MRTMSDTLTLCRKKKKEGLSFPISTYGRKLSADTKPISQGVSTAHTCMHTQRLALAGQCAGAIFSVHLS